MRTQTTDNRKGKRAVAVALPNAAAVAPAQRLSERLYANAEMLALLARTGRFLMPSDMEALAADLLRFCDEAQGLEAVAIRADAARRAA